MVERSQTEWWAEILHAHWDFDATVPVTPLDGEYDLNFRVGDVAVLKVMRAACDPEFVAMQIAALQHLEDEADFLPKLVLSRAGDRFVRIADPDGAERVAWVITVVPGKPYAEVSPHAQSLICEIGTGLGKLTNGLVTFDHPQLDREIKWNLANPLWAREHLALIGNDQRRIQLAGILDNFEERCVDTLAALPQQAIHNDLNDYNVLCHVDCDGALKLGGIIDFGDMIRGPVVCDVAIAAAYFLLDHPRPVGAIAALLEGCCRHRPLSEDEVALVWPLALTRIAVSALNAADMQRQKPEDSYVTISQAPIERFLQRLPSLNEGYIQAHLRVAAGFEAVPDGSHVSAWLAENADTFAPMFEANLAAAAILDLSVAGRDAPQDPIALDGVALTACVDAVAGPRHLALGRYAEPRLIYTELGFFAGSHPATDRRTVHMAIDVFLPAGTPVHAPLVGTVHSVDVCPEHLGYGGVLVLRHETSSGVPFYSLYGHLAHEVATRHRVGDRVAAGDVVALLGSEEENGGWAPHVHLQLGLFDLPGPEWPGVSDPDEWDIWQDLCPDPAAFLGLSPGHAAAPQLDVADLRETRAAQTTRNLKLSYRDPVAILRGWKSYLFDDRGRPYLDAYNNVPHVGHAHPRITEAVSRQMRLVNTNTRYLQPVHEAYAAALTERLPDPLNVCFLLSSGSEANEVALRLARAYTGATDTIVMEHGYHGHTCAAIDLSDYKFSGPGGAGKRDWVHVVPNPDTFRAPWGRDVPDAGARYAQAVSDTLTTLAANDRRAAAFISEVFPSVGGQIVPPDGYLPGVYDAVRAAGGVCIADEVQTGLGRLGRYPWAFEQQGAVPDIVVLGKPMGNGYPLAAVITTREIADAFANGMEFFTTFGGATVSCAAGHEVLRILDDEDLAGNAEVVGRQLLEGLRTISSDAPSVGDVRGIGLFIGVEMVEPDGSHATGKAAYVVNRLREQRILIGSDGPADNVLKIRPPLCFSKSDADYFLEAISGILAEDPLRNM